MQFSLHPWPGYKIRRFDHIRLLSYTHAMNDAATKEPRMKTYIFPVELEQEEDDRWSAPGAIVAWVCDVGLHEGGGIESPAGSHPSLYPDTFRAGTPSSFSTRH